MPIRLANPLHSYGKCHEARDTCFGQGFCPKVWIVLIKRLRHYSSLLSPARERESTKQECRIGFPQLVYLGFVSYSCVPSKPDLSLLNHLVLHNCRLRLPFLLDVIAVRRMANMWIWIGFQRFDQGQDR